MGLRFGESLALTDLRLQPGRSNPVRVSLVYPADATPGHLLSVVPVQQLAMLHQRQQSPTGSSREARSSETAFRLAENASTGGDHPNQETSGATGDRCEASEKPVPKPVQRQAPAAPPPLPAIVPIPRPDPRFTDAIRSQQQWLLQLQGR